MRRQAGPLAEIPVWAADREISVELAEEFLYKRSRGLFLESPENFSGSKNQLSNCNPLILKSWSFNMF